MYRKYLLKRKFWAVAHKEGSTPCYVYHDAHAGGIYAYIQQRGIVIKTDAETREFTNFDDLDAFLDRTFDPPPEIIYIEMFANPFIHPNR